MEKGNFFFSLSFIFYFPANRFSGNNSISQPFIIKAITEFTL